MRDLSRPRACDRPPPPLAPLHKGGKGGCVIRMAAINQHRPSPASFERDSRDDGCSFIRLGIDECHESRLTILRNWIA
jgi:hypothetical protein